SPRSPSSCLCLYDSEPSFALHGLVVTCTRPFHRLQWWQRMPPCVTLAQATDAVSTEFLAIGAYFADYSGCTDRRDFAGRSRASLENVHNKSCCSNVRSKFAKCRESELLPILGWMIALTLALVLCRGSKGQTAPSFPAIAQPSPAAI